MQKHELDKIDRKILNILMVQAKKPLKEIAEAVFLSIPAVSARIEKMEREGYILGYQAEINPVLMGYGARAFIQLEVPQEKKEQFYQYASSHPQVMECNCVTGEYSMLLQVCFPSMEDLEHFTGELQQFGKARTHVVFSTPVRHRGIRVEES